MGLLVIRESIVVFESSDCLGASLAQLDWVRSAEGFETGRWEVEIPGDVGYCWRGLE